MKYLTTTTLAMVLFIGLGLAQSSGQMTPLDKALQAARQDKSKANEFYNLFLKTDIYIPTHDTPKKPNTKRRAGDDEKFTPVLLTHEGKTLLPIFDTLERLEAWANRPIGFIRISAHALLEAIDSSFHIALNLGTDYFKDFVSDEIKALQNTVRGATPREQKVPAGTEVLVGAPAKIPKGLEAALRACLSKSKEIKAAYLGQVMYMAEGEKPHLVLVLEVGEATEDVFSAIVKDVGIAVMGLLKDGDYLDIQKYEGRDPEATIVKQVKLFYVRPN
ncbi:MAG TPA: enhanced serine sensitivity protein SseB C-terminal domain-containing protein [Blastocatellia bacterium]|nr:enhanced serine sensitivity protein SseB C-terminal domain-containing protein [Blastocatellia bacterium]